MIVCVCHRISHRDIERHAVACDSFDELQFSTGVATGCGRCGDFARAVFDDAREDSSRGAATHGTRLCVLSLAQA